MTLGMAHVHSQEWTKWKTHLTLSYFLKYTQAPAGEHAARTTYYEMVSNVGLTHLGPGSHPQGQRSSFSICGIAELLVLL